MKKFLLTLLFCIFANPIFAQTKPTTKTNLDIKIDTKTTTNLNNIKTSFTKHINDKLCNNKDIKIDSIKDKPFESTICGSTTIGETYNCICDTKNKKFYETVKAITNFEKLTGNIDNQFEQIINFYNALNSIPNLTSELDKFLTKIKELKQQDEDDKAREEAERKEIIMKLAEDLAKKLKEEKDLRNEYPDIVKDLKKDNKLKTHPDNGIENYMKNPTNNENDATTVAKTYIEKILKQKPDLKNNELENFFKENEEKERSETKITQNNIDAINDAKNKQEEEEEKTKQELLEKLRDLKKKEAKLINDLGDKTVNPTTTEKDFNNPENNKKLNTALNKLIGETETSPHPNKAAETIDDIKADIENTNNNIEKLTTALEKNNKTNDKLEKAYNDIKEHLHQQNLKECKLFKAIDHVTEQGIKNYKLLGISGSKITCQGLGTKTIEEMRNINNTTEKEKYIECLNDKVDLIKINKTILDKEIDINNEKLKQFKCTLECPYEGDFNEEYDYDNYNIWYNTNGTTKKKYKEDTFISIENQLEQCQLASKENAINNFTCPDNITVDNAKLSSIKAKMKEALNENLNKILEIGNRECSTAQKEAQIDNFTCRDVGIDIDINTDELQALKTKMKDELNKTPQTSFEDIKRNIAEKVCKEAYNKAQKEAEKTKKMSDLEIAIKELKDYCCNGTDINERNCPAETNIMGNKGNYRVHLSKSSANKIKELLKYVSELKCPDDKDIINDVHNRIFINTIYIGNSQKPNTQCEPNRKNISNNLNQRYSTSNTSESKNYLGLTQNFCKWNG